VTDSPESNHSIRDEFNISRVRSRRRTGEQHHKGKSSNEDIIRRLNHQSMKSLNLRALPREDIRDAIQRNTG